MIAGIGFAMMAWRLACERTDRFTSGLCNRPSGIDRGHCKTCDEYYRIIDNAAIGVAAYNVARRMNMLGENFTVKL